MTPSSMATRRIAAAAGEGYAVGLARAGDLAHLAAIEIAAARQLSAHAPASALGSTTPAEELRRAWRSGYVWVAFAGEVPVGFAMAARLETGALHLCELHVHPAHGRQGLGTRLVHAVCARAAREGLAWVTLTTFDRVPWNGPFYARLGFETSSAGVLAGILQDEWRRGLLGRVGMRRACIAP